jgi:hypothetical protein
VRVLPAEGFAEAVQARAAEIASLSSPRSTRIIKKQVYEALFQSLAEATAIANREQALCRDTEDFREGVRSYVEKRAPNFAGPKFFRPVTRPTWGAMPVRHAPQVPHLGTAPGACENGALRPGAAAAIAPHVRAQLSRTRVPLQQAVCPPRQPCLGIAAPQFAPVTQSGCHLERIAVIPA